MGHRWELFLAIGIGNAVDDPIKILGPISTCTVETRSWHGAFTLLQLVDRVKSWAVTEYWPWFCTQIWDPLERVLKDPGVIASGFEDAIGERSGDQDDMSQ